LLNFAIEHAVIVFLNQLKCHVFLQDAGYLVGSIGYFIGCIIFTTDFSLFRFLRGLARIGALTFFSWQPVVLDNDHVGLRQGALLL